MEQVQQLESGNGEGGNFQNAIQHQQFGNGYGFDQGYHENEAR